MKMDDLGVHPHFGKPPNWCDTAKGRFTVGFKSQIFERHHDPQLQLWTLWSKQELTTSYKLASFVLVDLITPLAIEDSFPFLLFLLIQRLMCWPGSQVPNFCAPGALISPVLSLARGGCWSGAGSMGPKTSIDIPSPLTYQEASRASIYVSWREWTPNIPSLVGIFFRFDCWILTIRFTSFIWH